MCIVVSGQLLSTFTVALDDRANKLFDSLQRAGKAVRQYLPAVTDDIPGGMLRDPELIYQHLLIGLFKAAVMARGGNCAMRIVIGLDDLFSSLLRDCLSKQFDRLFDCGDVRIRSAHASEVPNRWLEHIHRFVMIDNVDKLKCGNASALVRLQVDQPVGGQTDQRLAQRRT